MTDAIAGDRGASADTPVAFDQAPVGSSAGQRVSFVDEVQRTAEGLRQAGRRAIGTGGEVDRRGLRQLLRDEGVPLYPLVALMLLTLAELLHGEAWSVEQPDIARTFGLTPLFFNVLNLLTQVIGLVVPLAVARFVQNRARRALVTLVAAALFSVITPLTGLAIATWMLIVMNVADTTTTLASDTASGPLTIDLYPPQVRTRAVSALTVGGLLATILATGIVLLLTGPLDLNWRGVFVALGILATTCTVFATGLRDPGYGRYDTERLRALARAEQAPDDSHVQAKLASHHARGVKLSLFEAIRRIWMIKTMRVTLVGSVVGALSGPVDTYLTFFVANRFDFGAFQLALLSLAGSVVGIVSYLLLAPVADRIFQRNPAHLYYWSGALGILGIALTGAQVFSTSVVFLYAVSLSGVALSSLYGPALVVASMSIVPAPLRPHVGAMSGLFLLGGTAIGTAVLGGIASSVGLVPAVLISSSIGIAATVVGVIAGRSINTALDNVVEEVIEDEAINQLRERNVRIPMVALRGVDFSYGQTQVLFNVDFHVDDGEMVALLGVNGAGKSTLLRVLSGLGIPQRGSVRLAGEDITYLEANRRVQLGITQVPGGRAVFSDLTVVENLRCYAYQVGARGTRRRREVNERIDGALAAFSRLGERHNSLAGQLSGGEQQMLGLAKAYIMRPRLLVIDELSLGLAPLVVEQLLGMVRNINAEGAAVVIVEQSVNVALSISARACFMEQGQVMFDGPSRDLLQQRELLRSVFLSGVGAMTG